MKRNNKVKAGLKASLLFLPLVLSGCSQDTSVAPHECVFYPVEAVSSTCSVQGHIAYEQCPYCRKIVIDGVEKTEEEVTLPLDEHNHPEDQLEHIDEVEATCITDGNYAYDHCFACGNYILDNVNYTVDEYLDHVTIKASDEFHDLVHYEEIPASCISGRKAYDQCQTCGKYFTSGEEVTFDELVIPANGEHIFNEYGICENDCGSYTYNGVVFDNDDKATLTSAYEDGYCDIGDDKTQAIENTHANKMTFHTQRGSSSDVVVSYNNGESIDITFTSATKTNNNSFTRFSPGEGTTAYTGKFLLSFEVSVNQKTTIDRLGAMIVDYGGDAYDGQAKLLGVNSNSNVENNPYRSMDPNTSYRFIYEMNITNKDEEAEEGEEEQLVQIWICGGAGTYTLSNLHFIPLENEEASDTVDTTLLYFGKADQVLNEKDILANSISLDKTSITLAPNATEQLTATITPDITTDKTVTWASSNPDVATVDNNGLVTGVAEGKTTITATCGQVSATCEVIVSIETIDVTGVSLDRESLKMLKTASPVQLNAIVSPSNASNKNVTWTSSNPSVATVSDSGLITPVEVGETTITVTTEDGNYSANCAVTIVEEPHVITFNGNDFFGSENWTDPANSNAVYTDADIKDELGNLVFKNGKAGRYDLFYAADGLHFGDNQTKSGMDDVIGKTGTYDFTINSTGEYDMMILGTSGATSPTASSNISLYLHINEDGSVALNQNYTQSNYKFTDHFTCDSTSYKHNQDNKVTIILDRTVGSKLKVTIKINGEVVKLVGDAITSGNYSFSVDEAGTFTSTFVSANGMGQRVGFFSGSNSSVTISDLKWEITPNN